MATFIMKRGLKTNLPVLTIGELAFCTDTKELFIGSQNGNVMVYSNDTTINNLDNLIDVDTTTTAPSEGDMLTFKDGVWKPQTPNLTVSTGTYLIELSRWGITKGLPVKPYTNANFITANNNVKGINDALKYASDNGFSSIMLPRGEYAICYPNPIVMKYNNMIFDLNGSKLKVIYDSDNKSPFDTRIGTDYYNFVGNSIEFENVKNAHILNCTLIGCREDRSWINEDEKLQENSYGIVFSKSAAFSSVRHCVVSDYMGDAVVFFSTSNKDYSEFTLNLALGDIISSTGQPTASTTTMISDFITIPDGVINDKSFMISGIGNEYGTAITNKEFFIYFYREDNSYLRYQIDRRTLVPLTIPDDAKKFRLKFFETNTEKDMKMVMNFGLTPHHNIIEFNEFFNLHRGAVKIGGSYNVIQHNVLREIGTSFIDGKPKLPGNEKYAIKQSDQYGDNTVVRHNLIYGTNHAISINSYSTQIESNHIYYCDGYGVTLDSVAYANVNANFIYGCTGTIRLTSTIFPTSQIYITDNTFTKGITNINNTEGYTIIMKGNNILDPDGDIVFPTADSCIIKDNNIKLGTFFGPNSIKLIANKIEGCSFESKSVQRDFYIVTPEISRSMFVNMSIYPQTADESTKSEKVKIIDCRFTNSILNNDNDNAKQKTLEVINSRLVDTTIRLKNLSTAFENPTIKIKDSLVIANLITSIFKSSIDESNVQGIIELDNCHIQIGNAGFQYLLSHEYATNKSWHFTMKNSHIENTLPERQNLSYYLVKAIVNNFISVGNKFTNFNLPVVDADVFIGYDPTTHSVNEPTSGSFLASDIVYNGNPVAGGFIGWICINSGTATNTLWTASTNYSIGQIVYSGTNVYKCLVAGTSGTITPSHITGTAVDGSVTWEYVSSKAVFKTFGTISN